jgi:hypothetical protein
MKLKYHCRFGRLLIAVVISGCASFEPRLRLHDVLGDRTSTAKAEQESLEIAIEEFVSEEKSRQAFDADIAAHGVMAILLRAHNKSPKRYNISRQAVTVTWNGQNLASISGQQAADSAATSEYAGKALLWTAAIGPFALLFWPATVASSASHTQTVNQRIRNHFTVMEFSDTTLMPGQREAGFLYFRLPDSAKRFDDISLAIKAVDEQEKKELLFKLTLPLRPSISPVDSSKSSPEQKEPGSPDL